MNKATRTLAEVRAELPEVAKRHGYGVIATHDLTAMLAKKGKPIARQVVVFAICNRGHAQRVLTELVQAATALLCRIAALPYILEPHLGSMDRFVALGLEEAALEVCKGVLLGLYRLEEEEAEGVLAWDPDFPAEALGVTLERWMRGGPGRRVPKKPKNRQRPEFPGDFLDEHVPERAWRIGEVARRLGETLPTALRLGEGGRCSRFQRLSLRPRP